jgi:hypothetical protein
MHIVCANAGFKNTKYSLFNVKEPDDLSPAVTHWSKEAMKLWHGLLNLSPDETGSFMALYV